MSGSKHKRKTIMKKITHINPDGLYKNPVFSQAVVAEGGKNGWR
jgi:hypothetical protein